MHAGADRRRRLARGSGTAGDRLPVCPSAKGSGDQVEQSFPREEALGGRYMRRIRLNRVRYVWCCGPVYLFELE